MNPAVNDIWRERETGRTVRVYRSAMGRVHYATVIRRGRGWVRATCRAGAVVRLVAECAVGVGAFIERFEPAEQAGVSPARASRGAP